MKYQIILLCLIVISGSVWAKKAPKPSYLNTYETHYLNTKLADCDYNRYPIQNTAKRGAGVLSFLKQHKAFLFENNQSLKLVYTKKSPYATHYTYQQYFNQVPVYGSQIKVNVDKSNAIYTAFYNTFKTKNSSLPIARKTTNPIKQIKQYYTDSDDKISIDTAYTCIIFKDANTKPVYATVANITNSTQHWHHQVVIDEALNMVYAKDLRTYFCNQDTEATGKIFNPDPLTTAMVAYGDMDANGDRYIDNDDRDQKALDNETTEVMIPVCLENGTYTLNSAYAVIKELEAPVTEIPVSNDGTFLFTRDEPGFEDVNAIYHLNVFKKYLDEIFDSMENVHGQQLTVNCDNNEFDCNKIDKLVDFPIEVDAHAVNGADQSYFDPDLNVPGLLFGEGGVDDAEDADVVVHEYGHAIVHSAAPYTNNGKERQSIDEGFGDYLAASYSRTINEFGWERVFSWDGHNNYWEGRSAKTPKRYPFDVSPSNIHSNGEMWSSALMEIWPIIGRRELDKIVFGSLYCYNSNTSMDAAAKLLVKADSLINDGAYFNQIWSSMNKYGFLPYQVFAGTDTAICSGNSVRLGGENLEPPGISISWSPTENLLNSQAFNPTATPSESTWYFLTATNQNTQEQFTDSVFVKVEECRDEEIGLLNSQNFLGGENLFLSLPNMDEINYKVDLFNMQGKKIDLIYEQFSISSYQLAVNNLPSGAYFLRVFDEDSNPHIFRFVRVR